ncbi:hypothetical protein [Sigmofec virus UA08Rod_5935]|uniref:Uncharacterized protein n=1 Tax=Sigmofec virus UA08Rod_5935 TaxID=2929446 RepID=A0A976R796_9VIRU|nr:hypothetical protein [Sigmofec virus UA08Rod_5935]
MSYLYYSVLRCRDRSVVADGFLSFAEASDFLLNRVPGSDRCYVSCAWKEVV